MATKWVPKFKCKCECGWKGLRSLKKMYSVCPKCGTYKVNREKKKAS